MFHFINSVVIDIQYNTLKTTSEALLQEKGSKFLAYAFSVVSIDDFKTELEKLKAQHPKANHHCFAYRIGAEGSTYRANDDGEPSGSAGVPILNQLRSDEITNCAVIVVRYFGGTKLGVSGLISAYRQAAELAIQENTIVNKVVLQKFSVKTTYDNLGLVERIFNQYKVSVLEKNFTDTVSFLAEIKPSEFDAFSNEFSQLSDFELLIK